MTESIDSQEGRELVSLQDAVAKFQRSPGSPQNAYAWYRRSAHAGGAVWIGGERIPAFKIGRSWMVERSKLDEVMRLHQEAQQRKQTATDDYAKHVLHGSGASTSWGGYSVQDDFHFAWSTMDVALKRSDGAWYCNHCWSLAALRHEREECHRCRDWSPCGRDCTLSAIACPSCGTKQAV